MNKVKNSYENGECPDCQEPIPDDVVEGQACVNCGHAFFEEKQEENEDELECQSVLYHGPGHQSQTKCEIKGEHTIHQTTYGNFDYFMQWKGKTADTSFFDEPVDISHEDQQLAFREREELECQAHLRKKELVASLIFDHDYMDDEVRPHEETCHEIAEEIITHLGL